MDLDKSTEKSFEYARDTSKLLITLSTAIVAFCATVVTESKVLMPQTNGQRILLAISWITFLASTALGVWAQLAITDVLGSAIGPNQPSIWNRKITVPLICEIVLFPIGLLALVIYTSWRVFG